MIDIVNKYFLINDNKSIILARLEGDDYNKIHLHTTEGNRALGDLIRAASKRSDDVIIPIGVTPIHYGDIRLLINTLETEVNSRYKYYIGRSKRQLYTIIRDLNEYREQCEVISRLGVDK